MCGPCVRAYGLGCIYRCIYIYTPIYTAQAVGTHARPAHRPSACGVLTGLSLRVKDALQLLVNRYGLFRFAQVPERVSTKSAFVLIIRNSKSNHLGAQGTFISPSLRLGLELPG